MTWPIKSSGETKNIKTTQNSNLVMHIILDILIFTKRIVFLPYGDFISIEDNWNGEVPFMDLSWIRFNWISHCSIACSKYSDRWGPGLGWCRISSTLWRDILTSPSLLLSRGNFMKDKDVQVDQSF